MAGLPTVIPFPRMTRKLARNADSQDFGSLADPSIGMRGHQDSR